MANREACEVYIDQEIEHGLKEGKTPYSIGKDLSKWIVKLFEVKIKPTTIEKRAERQKQLQLDFPTNVGKKSETPMDKGSTTVAWNSGKGGKREGAGRPKVKPAVTERDKEIFAQFTFPIGTISRCTFTVDECHSLLMEATEREINNFKKALELLNAVNANGANI